VGPHTKLWTADHNEHALDLATQQQDFNENPFRYEHLQIQWAMMAKSELHYCQQTLWAKKNSSNPEVSDTAIQKSSSNPNQNTCYCLEFLLQRHP
jgi:hypothetical protein